MSRLTLEAYVDRTAENDWQRVRGIFDDALRHLPEVRPDFVRDACAGDPVLQTEVESLLASLASAELFLETPAVVQIAENLLPDEGLLVGGQILGHYEIRELLGSGGMGEVYLARDTRLNRNVAIKVLHENFRPDHHANRRLLREARAAALLEHPNICQIYEIAETPEHNFIVMQYVVGTTLADLLANQQLAVNDALDLAIQIVDGLAEAHSQGIIHRDIKPANVIVNGKGQAKILDFGLAKFIEADAGAETSQRLNTSGAVMGTVPFMSPEQLRGKIVDQRSDLFSVGSLLYEMLSGRPAFHRESNAETISAILNDEPDWDLIPEPLRPILQKCLAKETDARYRSARDLADDLRRVRANTAEELPAARTSRAAHPGNIVTNEPTAKNYRQSYFWQSFGESSEEAPKSGADTATARVLPNRANSYVYAAASFGLLVLAASSIYLWQMYRSVDPDGDFNSLRPVRLVQWRSGASSNDTDYRVSHDGKMVAYSSSKHGGDEVIYVKQTGDGEEIRVTKDEWRNVSPIWSPDDQRIAFISVRENEPGIYAVPSLGGNVTPLLVTEKANLSLRHWSKDGGSIYYEQLGNLYRLEIATRTAERITALPDSPAGNDRYFTLSPDETDIAYCDVRDGQRDIWTVPVRGGEPHRVTNDTGEEHRPIWHPDGQRILYNVLRNDFFQINLAYRDAREPLQVTRGEGNYELIDLSPDGSRIYYTSWEKRSDISTVRVATGDESETAAGLEVEMWAEGSPDGRAIVYQTNASPNPTANLHKSALVVRFADGRTATVANNGYDPRWLPDSRHIAFLRWHEAERKNQLWLVNTVNGQERQLTTDSVAPPSIGLMPISRSDVAEFDFSPDGSRFVYVDFQKPRNVRIGSTDESTSTKLTDSTTTDVRFFSPLFSPDGQKVAFVSMRKPAQNPKKPEWGITFFDGGNVKIAILSGSIRMIGWAASGDAVIVARIAGQLKVGPSAVEILRVSESSGTQEIAILEDIHADTLTLSADGKTLAFTGRRNDKDDVWTISATGGEPRKLTNNGNTRIFYANLAWSPDGKVIYFDKQEQVNTISMFENFR
jgi:serine/threonine protein kinase/tricorn protease-like protein